MSAFVAPSPSALAAEPRPEPIEVKDPCIFSQTELTASEKVAPLDFLPMSVSVGTGTGSVSMRYLTCVPLMARRSMITFLPAPSSFFSSVFFSSAVSASCFSEMPSLPFAYATMRSKLLEPASSNT